MSSAWQNSLAFIIQNCKNSSEYNHWGNENEIYKERIIQIGF